LTAESTNAMRYWWVNQNQTYRTEVRGNFMWSPKANANGARNQFYEKFGQTSSKSGASTQEPGLENSTGNSRHSSTITGSISSKD